MKLLMHKTEWGRWFIVAIFAIAMAWVESAVVFYLLRKTSIGLTPDARRAGM